MAKRNNALMDRIEAMCRSRELEARHMARVYQMDMVTIALGRMGWGEKRFDKFDALLAEVMKEYGDEMLSDYEQDRDLWYAKSKLDRELSGYVGARFVPFDERYA